MAASAIDPLLLTVTVCAALVLPTPVVWKISVAGRSWIEPAAPPMPVRTALAAFTNDFELTESEPVTVPLPNGANMTPGEQLAPAASVAEQVFCTRLKLDEVESATPMAATVLVLVI